jgi:hypothetical protein
MLGTGVSDAPPAPTGGLDAGDVVAAPVVEVGGTDDGDVVTVVGVTEGGAVGMVVLGGAVVVVVGGAVVVVVGGGGAVVVVVVQPGPPKFPVTEPAVPVNPKVNGMELSVTPPFGPPTSALMPSPQSVTSAPPWLAANPIPVPASASAVTGTMSSFFMSAPSHDDVCMEPNR